MEGIFGYGDYRDYLKYVLRLRCSRNRHYSQRAFARDIQIVPHRLSQVLRGKQGISRKAALKMSESLNMSESETQYFCDLVDSLHCRSQVGKREALARAIQAKQEYDLINVPTEVLFPNSQNQVFPVPRNGQTRGNPQ